VTRTEFIRERDGESEVEPYRKLMRAAYRGAVLRLKTKKHPFRRAWIEGYLEFKR